MTTPARPPITPDRWRAIDHVLQDALTCTREHRDEFVARSCGDDAALRNEVSSLLAAYDSTPGEFLERPAADEQRERSAAAPGSPPARGSSPAPAARIVSARFMVYATAAGILLGGVTGWTLAHSTTVDRWRGTFRAIRQQANATSNPSSASGAGGAGAAGELSLVIVDRSGQVVRQIAASQPATPRFSPNGRRLAYAAVGEGRQTSDIWITDLADGAERRLTNDDAESSTPQWSPDGGTIAFATSVTGGTTIAEQSITGGGARLLVSRPGTQFPTDWLRDGSALLVSADGGNGDFDILVQPANGGGPTPYAGTRAQETAARVSPHTHWVAYTSNESGRDEVYVDSYPQPGFRVTVSRGGGIDPAWRRDGRELYYWRGDALIAVPIDGSNVAQPPVLGGERVLFHSAYEHSLNSMYDVSPDGERIAIVRRR